MRKRLLLTGLVLLAVAGVLLAVGVGRPPERPAVAPTEQLPAQSGSGSPATADEAAVAFSDLRFDQPDDAADVQRIRDGESVEEVRFVSGDFAARVRVQPASDEDSVRSLEADYRGQGETEIVTVAGRRTVVVTSAADGAVSQLAVSVSQGRLLYSQVGSSVADQARGRALLLRLQRSLRVTS